MSKNLKLFKRVTCILGVAFLMMGMVPLQKAPRLRPRLQVLLGKGQRLGSHRKR